MADDVPALDVVRLGAQGDGIAECPEGPRYIPFALPGERVRPQGPAAPILLSAPSNQRREAECRHFGVCGGCVAQHMSDALYADWKRSIVVEAFRQRGLTPEIEALMRISPSSRRRAIFTAVRQGGAFVLGYHPRESHDVFAVRECPVLVPEIVERLDALRRIAVTIDAAREIRLTVLSTRSGLDVAVAADRHRIDAKQSAQIAQIAAEHRAARISVDGHTIVQRVSPMLEFASVEVCPPPGAFVQAVEQAETAIADEVTAATGKARKIADLFSGLGAWTFHLARTAAVEAFDSDRDALDALKTAARRAKGVKPVETKVRDLFREPLSSMELDRFGMVVFDPPRAGAKAQAEQIAASSVACVVAVSCNPGTLARDVRILVEGGFRLHRVVPIDQFLYSAHVETVAILRR